MADEMSKTKRSSSRHALIYVVLVSALAVSGYFNYIYSSTKQSVGSSTASCMTMEQLPATVRASYVAAADYNTLLVSRTQLEAELNSAKNALQNMDGESEQQDSFMAQENQEQGSKNKDVIMVKDFAKCYDMGNANRKVTDKCRKDIIAYVNKHKDAKYFEIIGMVDDLEFNLFENLERRKSLHKRLGVDQRVIDKLKKYTQRGLAKDRASEASWVIKSYTNKKAATYNANYELISKKGQKGVIIRAYK